MRGWIVVVVLGSACGRFGFGPDPDAREPRKLPAYGAATLIATLADPNARDDDPSVTEDRLELYFNSDRPPNGQDDIWVARRSSSNMPWGTPELVVELSTALVESNPEVSADGLTILLSRRLAGNNTDIFVATRPNRASAWSTPIPIDGINTASQEYAAALVADGLEMVLSSTRLTGTTVTDLFLATRAATTDAWSAIQHITELDNPTTTTDGSFADEQFLAYQRIVGSADIYVAERPARGAPFAAPRPLEINTTFDETDAWLSSDLQLLLFASDRSGNYELYEARALP